MRYISKRTAVTLAVVAAVLGMITSLLSAAINAMPEDEPLSTVAAELKPLYVQDVPNPPPDTRRILKLQPSQPAVVPPPIPVVAPKPPEPVKVKPVPPKVQTIKPKTQAPPVNPGTASFYAAEKALAFALAQRGKPYRWGATGPSSFDCSGLVMRAYQSAGVTLPRTTKTMMAKGKSVSRAALVRGDLVWTSSGHVGLYVGNNQIVHAPQAGDVVKVSTIWSFYAARRVA